MFPTSPVHLRRPLTPVLERGEYSPSPPVSEPACTFDPRTTMPIFDPEVTKEQLTSSQADHMHACLTDQLVYGDVKEIVEEIRDSPRAKFPVSELQSLCEVYTGTRRSIHRLERDLVKIKKRLKKASDDFARNHKRVMSSTSRHRQQKGFREVANEKTAKCRQHCRNLELGYCQERPQLEQMKIVLNIFKASVSELEQSNKYLTNFMGVMKKRQLKPFEQQNLEHIRNKPARKTDQDFRQEFEDALRNQLDIRNLGNPSYRQYINHHELMKRFGRNLPRPPFAPLNVFKLKTLSSYVGKSVCKEKWVLAGRKCQRRDMESNIVTGEGLMGHSKLPSIGVKPFSDPIKTWMPRKSIVRHFPSPDTTQVNPNGCRGLKYYTSNTLLGKQWGKRSSAYLQSLNTSGDGNVTEQENDAVSEPQYNGIRK